MLVELKIKNFAIVEDLHWRVADGLTVITGQTGAGKSIILGALKLALGQRANRDCIRQGESACVVEAVFHLADTAAAVGELLDTIGISACEDGVLVIRRSIGGRSRQFINDSPCTLATLKTLSAHLVDMHEPHDHLSLTSPSRQLDVVDSYAQTHELLEAYQESYQKMQRISSELQEIRDLGDSTSAEVELLRYQVEEIEAANLDVAEVAELEVTYSRMHRHSRLVSDAEQAVGQLALAVEALSEAQKPIRDLMQGDREASAMLQGFSPLRLEFDDVYDRLERYHAGLDIDEAEMARIESRIDTVERLKRKYGSTVEAVVERFRQMQSRLLQIETRSERIDALEAELTLVEGKTERLAADLSARRKHAAAKMQPDIQRNLIGLGFRQAVFEIAISEQPELAAYGADRVEFLFSPNPGVASKPLRTIASSGELSRIILAIKSSIARRGGTPVMIFDEIDANVGGEIAGAVGEKMATLSQYHQVLAISHMPQVAAKADSHFVVNKSTAGDATVSEIRQVSEAARPRELARMLGGIGAESVALAEKMLAV